MKAMIVRVGLAALGVLVAALMSYFVFDEWLGLDERFGRKIGGAMALLFARIGYVGGERIFPG